MPLDIQYLRLAPARQSAYGAADRRITRAYALLDGSEYRGRAEEYPRVVGVVRFDLFSDPDQPVIIGQHLRYIAEVNQMVLLHSEIGRQDDISLLEPLPDKLYENDFVENVVAHKQHERLTNSLPRLEKRAPVAQLPPFIPDRGDSYAPAPAQIL